TKSSFLKDWNWDYALLVPSKTFVPAGQGRLRQILHCTKKIGLYFRGVNGPPLQTIIVIVKATVCQRLLRESVMYFWSGMLRRILRSEEHTSELQSRFDLVCRLLLEKKKKIV